MFTEQEQEEAGGEKVLILEVYIPECRTILIREEILAFWIQEAEGMAGAPVYLIRCPEP